MNPAISLRIAIVAVILAVAQGAASYVETMSVVTAESPPEMDVKEVPDKIGDWHGEDAEVEEDVFRLAGALAMVNRRYRHPEHDLAVVSVAAFATDRFMVPHEPPRCYAAAGWRITEERRGKDGIGGVQLHLEKNTERIVVYYWYQLGDAVATTRSGLRAAFQNARRTAGKPVPLVKVMLQTRSWPTEEDALARLQELAAPLHDWVKKYR